MGMMLSQVTLFLNLLILSQFWKLVGFLAATHNKQPPSPEVLRGQESLLETIFPANANKEKNQNKLDRFKTTLFYRFVLTTSQHS